MAGGIFTAANPSFVGRELANQLKDSGAAYLLVTEAALDTALEAAKLVGLSTDRIRYFDADALFEKSGMDKAEQKGVKYWASIFANESEGRKYQWPELKGKLTDLSFISTVSSMNATKEQCWDQHNYPRRGQLYGPARKRQITFGLFSRETIM